MAKKSKKSKPVKKAASKPKKKSAKPAAASKSKSTGKKAKAKKPVAVNKKKASKPAPAKKGKATSAKAKITKPVKKVKTSSVKPVKTKVKVTEVAKTKAAKPSPAPKKEKPAKVKAEPKAKEVKKKKKKLTLEDILNQPKPPIFVKKVELPKIVYPNVTSGKKQFKIEYAMKASPHLLYNYLSTASGLAAWFANDVNIRDNMYTFFWNGSSARARVIAQREDLVMAYQWIDETDNSYFVFEILQDDITGDVALIVTDFAFPAELEQNRMLWNSQISALSQVIGS